MLKPILWKIKKKKKTKKKNKQKKQDFVLCPFSPESAEG